jgi:hypothetical protein
MTREIVQFEFLKPNKMMEVFFPDKDIYKMMNIKKDDHKDSLLVQCGAFISMAVIVLLLGLIMLIIRTTLKKYKEKVDKKVSNFIKH